MSMSKIYVAVVTGAKWPPPGVEDTPENRKLRDKLTAEVKEIKDSGKTPYIPWEYADD